MNAPQENTKLPPSDSNWEGGLSSFGWSILFCLFVVLQGTVSSDLYATGPIKNCGYIVLLEKAKRLGIEIPSNTSEKTLFKIAEAAVLAADPGPKDSVFHFKKNSKWFNEFDEWTIVFEYKEYKIDLTAEAIPLGKTLILEDLSIEFPRLQGKLMTERVAAGSSEVLAGVKTLRRLAREAGFSYLVITAERVTGAKETLNRADSKVLMPFKLN